MCKQVNMCCNDCRGHEMSMYIECSCIGCKDSFNTFNLLWHGVK